VLVKITRTSGKIFSKPGERQLQWGRTLVFVFLDVPVPEADVVPTGGEGSGNGSSSLGTMSMRKSN